MKKKKHSRRKHIVRKIIRHKKKSDLAKKIVGVVKSYLTAKEDHSPRCILCDTKENLVPVIGPLRAKPMLRGSGMCGNEESISRKFICKDCLRYLHENLINLLTRS